MGFVNSIINTLLVMSRAIVSVLRSFFVTLPKKILRMLVNAFGLIEGLILTFIARTARFLTAIWPLYLLGFILVLPWFVFKNIFDNKFLQYGYVGVVAVIFVVFYLVKDRLASSTPEIKLSEWDSHTTGGIGRLCFKIVLGVLIFANGLFFQDRLPQTPIATVLHQVADDNGVELPTAVQKFTAEASTIPTPRIKPAPSLMYVSVPKTESSENNASNEPLRATSEQKVSANRTPTVDDFIGNWHAVSDGCRSLPYVMMPSGNWFLWKWEGGQAYIKIEKTSPPTLAHSNGTRFIHEAETMLVQWPDGSERCRLKKEVQ